MATYTGDDAANTFYGDYDHRNNATMNGGNDYAEGGDLVDTLAGGTGNDTLAGGGSSDYLYGDDGNDALYGQSGDDVLSGSVGDDYLSGGAGDDVLYGSDSGFDRLLGGGGGDILYFDQGDSVDAGSGDDLMYMFGHDGAALMDVIAGTGDDTIYGYGGHGALNGGAGEDTIDYRYLSNYYGLTSGVIIDLLSGRGGGDATGDSYWSIEDAFGTILSDTLIGNGSINVLSGDAGDDTLAGGGGGDYLDGGTGVDTLDYTTSPSGVRIDLALGTAYGGDAQEDIFRNIQSVTGSAYADQLTGDAADNTLRGAGGADILIGADGVDTLSGAAGNDRLTGGLGADILNGGTGADTFVFKSTLESPTGAGRDRIIDFNHADGDKIDLSGIDANTAASQDQAFTFIGTAAFGGNPGELRYSISGAYAVVTGDINGDKVADFQINVGGDTTQPLVAADFVL